MHTPSSTPRERWNAGTRCGALTAEPAQDSPARRARNFRHKPHTARFLEYGFLGWFCGQNARAQTDGSRIEERERGGHTGDRARERGGSTKRLSVLGAHPQDQRPPTTRADPRDS
jgi:hypothetical protein